MRQLVSSLARSGLLGDAVAALRSELRPAAGWCVQQRGAAAAAGGSEEQPPPSTAHEAPATADTPAAAADQAPAAAAKQEQPAASARQQPGKAKVALVQQAAGKPKPKPKQAKQGAPSSPASSAARSPTPDGVLSGSAVAQLLEAPLHKYFEVPAGILPEASADYYRDSLLKGESVHEPDYGCKGVQREWEWSGRRSLLARTCVRDLVAAVQGRSRRHLYLDGWAGSGKSVALYSLVAWARANGWISLYIPSAFSLVQTGTFFRGEDGLYDTPEAARWVLSSLRDSHAEQLASLKTPSGQPLPDLIDEGLALSTKPAGAVAAAIAAKEALAAQRELPFLLAVDDYNVLYSHTGYYESVHSFHRRQLAPDELRLVRAFRVMEQPGPANGVAVAAPSFGQTITDKLRLPRPQGSRFAVPRYGVPEVAAAADFFLQEVMHTRAAVPDEVLRRVLFLTNGNAAELRRFMPGLLGLSEDPLGLSRGYKAQAAHRTKYDQGQL